MLLPAGLEFRNMKNSSNRLKILQSAGMVLAILVFEKKVITVMRLLINLDKA
jgi:hypothetical protein